MLGIEHDSQRMGGRSVRNGLASPGGRCAVRAHSPHTAPTCAVASMLTRAGVAPGATSITSSTMRFKRSTLSLTSCVSWRCAPLVASSASSALACEIAASGLRISCAMPADTRPIAASFSCRVRASTAAHILD